MKTSTDLDTDSVGPSHPLFSTAFGSTVHERLLLLSQFLKYLFVAEQLSYLFPAHLFRGFNDLSYL